MHRLWWKLHKGWTEGKPKKTILLFSPLAFYLCKGLSYGLGYIKLWLIKYIFYVKILVTYLPYKIYLVSLHSDMIENEAKYQIKVIHVHFLHGHKNFYFGSVAAIYKRFSEKDIGVGQEYLRHQLLHDGNHYINDKVIIIRSRLLR